MLSHKFHLELTRRAKTDLVQILSYTEEVWGERQADEYQAIVDKALAAIEQNPRVGHKKSGIKTKILCLSAGRHLIFYVITGHIINVLRILHDSMDHTRHLNE